MAEDPAERTLDDSDQADVEEALQFVQAKWRQIGVQLRLKPGILDKFNKLEPAEAMGKVVEEFLAGNYDTDRFGPPTWKKIIQAVEKPSGGKNAAEAKKIAENYANKVKIKSSYSNGRTVQDKHPVPETLPVPEVLPYQESKYYDYFPHSEGRKVEMDGSDSKIVFQQYSHWPKDDRLNEVKMSFGAVKPIQGEKKASVAGLYDMTKWPHGICVVINNEEFSKHSNREGTNLDECNVVQTFRHLGYLVEVHRDCDAAKMRDIFEDMRKRDHSQYDSFVCCIMSHGNAGHIYGSDSKRLPLESIADRFKGEKCETLKGKPKMFFMQACRGLNKDKAVRVAKDSGEESSATATDPEQVVSDSDGETIPDAADFFFSYATPLNHVAWRDLDNGSWYVSELCTSLTSYGTFSSLVDMVTRTNGQVAEKYSTQGFKQEPDFNSRLRKDVFFF